MEGLSDDQLLEELKSRFFKTKEDLEIFQRLTEELKIVNTKLAESEAHKSHFISHITNEINNPFTSILGLSKNIMDMPSGNEHRMRSMAKLIYDEAYVLDFQLKNIFAAAKIEAGNLSSHISRTEIRGMINRVISSMEHLAEQQKVNIKVVNLLRLNEKGYCFINTDAEKLELTLTNLCNNAIRFSKPGFDVTVTVESLTDDKIRFAVQNFGKLLNKKEMQEMFDRFKRLEENINSINPGQGLGLSVANAYAQVLHSEIKVESTEEDGNRFAMEVKSHDIEGGENITEPDGYELFTEDEELF